MLYGPKYDKICKKKDGILSKNEPKIRKIMKITMRYGLLNEKMRQKYKKNSTKSKNNPKNDVLKPR